MTEAEARQRLTELKEHNNWGGSIPEVFDMAIKALEKQIAKKPIIKQWCPAKCPTCKQTLSESKGDGYWKHYTSLSICDCGQRLDWEDSEV